MDYISEQLSKQLNGLMSLDEASPAYVFKWLKAADELQQESLQDMCINALGTYLLPQFHKHSATFRGAMSVLSSTILTEVIVATGRCRSCLEDACKDAPCTCSLSYSEKVVKLSRCPKECSQCSFRTKGPLPAPRMATVCGSCNKLLRWVQDIA